MESKIYVAIGAASMCWENVSGAGVFDSNRAALIGEQLLADVRFYLVGETQDGPCRRCSGVGCAACDARSVAEAPLVDPRVEAAAQVFQVMGRDLMAEFVPRGDARNDDEWFRAVAAALGAARAEIAQLEESRGVERLVHAIQEQRLREDTDKAPRWDEDRVVIENGWLDGRCGRCGEALPDAAALGAARAHTDAIRELQERIRTLIEHASLVGSYVHVETLAAVLGGEPE